MPTVRRKRRKRQPRQQRAHGTVAVILRATAQILSRDGLAAVTTNRVAQRAGVSIGSLYQYFPDKAALVAEVRRRYDDAFRERMMALVADIGPLPLRDAVGRCVQALIDVHAEDPGLHNAVSAAGVEASERRLLHQLAASWLEARRDEVRRPNRAMAAAVAMDAAEALIHGAALRTPQLLADEAFSAEVTDLLVRYLGDDNDRPERGSPGPSPPRQRRRRT
jgi:AcrR family transcriptional regulator